jgi:hypothetical protein
VRALRGLDAVVTRLSFGYTVPLWWLLVPPLVTLFIILCGVPAWGWVRYLLWLFFHPLM